MPLYHDASHSWSGYAYQGKVGIFVLLKHLNAYHGNQPDIHFHDWKLEFEWLEDFSIMQGNRYISMHQVKTLNNTNIAAYESAIRQVLCNAWAEYTYQITPYFHVSSNVRNPHNIFYEYQYSGNSQKYCSLNQIDDLIKAEISTFLSSHNIADNNPVAIDTHFFKLLSIIDNHVKTRHHIIQTTRPTNRQIERISFTEIVNSLTMDSKQLSNERMTHEKKAYFAKVIDEFSQDKTNEIKEKLKVFAREAFDLEDDFVKFSKSTIPHIPSIFNKEMSIVDFQDSLHRDLLKGALLKIIERIDKNYDQVGHKFIYEKDHNKFLPTAITRSQDDCSEICSSILENPFAVEDLYEMDFFITERINCDSIEAEAKNFNEIRDEDLQNPENKANKINELKEVAIIDIGIAKGVLDA